MHDPIKELLELTQPYLNRPDLIQGPGGNTSIKDDNGRMFIKASGFRFEEMNLSQGISCVKYNPISDFFRNVVVKDKSEAEKESLEIILSNVFIQENGIRYPKPSMETGFHALLDKYVVHTHSVWSNLINCCKDSGILINALQNELNISVSYIPFVSPGFGLSYSILNEINRCKNSTNAIPKIFFLENHGIIAHSNSKEELWDLLSSIDSWISGYFSLKIKEYPSIKLIESNGRFSPADSYTCNIIEKEQCDAPYFNTILFPDQTVFFKDNIGNTGSNKKIQIENGKVIFNCPLREASSCHETLTAYLFIRQNILKRGFGLRVISDNEIDYIQNMDMEKHRKSLMNKSKRKD